jgi:hypothetical protein
VVSGMSGTLLAEQEWDSIQSVASMWLRKRGDEKGF